ncbi:restriction endonuclease [Moorena sp. SIO4E2]|uniref:restriction endonuclease n=1 Tax=Moorena sp. SIO4E2 TaxID=2607826 RepID=UPI00257D8309|nr:restriction endonuclease [Moorena sp. SIO4E2]
MDEVVRKFAALGLPGVILLIAMATTGFTGAAAITAALAMLGPFGMIGGIAFLGVVGIAADGLSKFGLEALLVGIYKERQQEGESKASLCKEIERLMVSRDLKRKLKEEVNNGKSSVEDRRASNSSSFDNLGIKKYKVDWKRKLKAEVNNGKSLVDDRRESKQDIDEHLDIESIEDIDEHLDIIDKMKGREFKKFMAKLFKELGYQVRLTPASADYGADLVIEKGEIKTVVQAKRQQSTVGIKAVQEVTGAIGYYQANLGLVITNSKFTENAKKLAAKTEIELFDRDDLKKLIKKVYKQKPSEDS